MVKQAVAARTAEDLDPIDRLEDKIKRLVELIAQLRADQENAAGENRRLSTELETLRTQLGDAERANAELTALRDERDMIRTRVTEMLEQLEGI